MRAKFDYSTLIEPYLSGETPKELGEKHGIDGSTIYRRLRALGVPMRNLSSSQAGKARPDRQGVPILGARTFDYERAKELYETGRSLSEVAEELGTTDELVRRALKVQGVARRRRGCGDGEKNHQHKGGKGLHSAGYVTLRGSRNPPLEHRVIAEKALGKPLPDGVIVHHVDTNRANNANANLVICTEEYHAELHARMRKHPYWSQFNK